MQDMDKIREKLNDEKIVRLELSYCSVAIQDWSGKHKHLTVRLQQILFIQFFLSILKQKDIACMANFHLNSSIFALFIQGIPKNIPLEYHYIIHESLSLLLGLNDICYPYEQHKYLCLGKYSHLFSEWGMGAGEISLHCDDIYEDVEIELLSLSIWRDITKTPTILLHPREIIKNLNNDELLWMFEAKAEFKSGKNVEISKSQIKPLAFYRDGFGVGFNLDFRIDGKVGERMLGLEKKTQLLIYKLKEMLKECEFYTFGVEDSFLMAVNKKVLHGRGQLNVFKHLYNTSNLSCPPRVLLRNKGVAQKTFEDPLSEAIA